MHPHTKIELQNEHKTKRLQGWGIGGQERASRDTIMNSILLGGICCWSFCSWVRERRCRVQQLGERLTQNQIAWHGLWQRTAGPVQVQMNKQVVR